MKKWVLGACAALLLSLMLTTSASGWSVTQTKLKTLTIAGDVTFTSAFSAADGETITITIWPSVSTVTIDDVELVKVTPKPKIGWSGCSISDPSPDPVTDDEDVKVTLTNNCRGGKSKFHLWLYLSTGEHIGVNVAFGR